MILLIAQLQWGWLPDAIHAIPKVVPAVIPMARAEWSGLSDSVKATAEGQFRLAVVQALGAGGAALALAYTARTYRLSYRGQVTDRFSKALERLGAQEPYIRVGAVHALEQILYDAPDQAGPAAQVLASFVRERSTVTDDDDIRLDDRSTPDDVQIALTTMTRINIRSTWPLDLSGLSLPGADFHRADLSGVRLCECRLTSANFYFARLAEADLTRVQCEGAVFDQADLEGAVLDGADLSKSRFRDADLAGAFMGDVYLQWAHFERARIVKAFLGNAKAEHALFDDADLRGARLADAKLRGTRFRGARLDGADLDNADLHKADLYCAKGLTLEQVVAARPTSWTMLPQAIGRNPRVIKRILEVEAEQGMGESRRIGFNEIARRVGIAVSGE
ncbi:pentapeptide repeat-containing protein [Streptomyces typhae]|nr:pentapeptide repeat-containing protein [Streptomyces typhae]